MDIVGGISGKKFLGKVFWVMMAVVFALIVFVGNYFLFKYANMWRRIY